MTTEGWGRGGTSDSPGAPDSWHDRSGWAGGAQDAWGPASDASGSGWAGASDSGWGPGSGDSWGGGGPGSVITIPKAASIVPLLAGILAGLTGIVVSFFGTGNSLVIPVLGWVLCAVLDVLAVAAYQVDHLRRASQSMAYRPIPGAGALGGLALALAAAGIVLNSLQIAQWVATR